AELARAAAEDRYDGEPTDVLALALFRPLILPDGGGQRIQIVIEDEEDRCDVSIYSQLADAEASAEWTRHATAEVRRGPLAPSAKVDLAAVQGRCAEHVDVANAYATYASVGLHYGPAFQGMQSLRRGRGEALAEIVLPESAEAAALYGVHP